jgi:hypothetical protein
LLVAAGFAILGTTVDYKKEGQVTKWGRIAIIGVIVSGLISTMLLGIEERAKAKQLKQAEDDKIVAQNKANDEKVELNTQFQNLVTKAEDNIERTEKNLDTTNLIAQDVSKSIQQQSHILNQLQNQLTTQRKVLQQTNTLQQQQTIVSRNVLRSIMPLDKLRMSYIIKYPLEIPEFRNFVEKLKDYVLSNNSAEKRQNLAREQISFEMYLQENQKTLKESQYLKRVTISLDSPFFSKNLEKNSDIPYLLKPELKIYFYKKGVEIPEKYYDLFLSAFPSDGKPDDSLKINVHYPFPGRNKAHDDFYSGVFVWVSTSEIERSTDASDNIRGFADFPGYMMEIQFPCKAELLSFTLIPFYNSTGNGPEYGFPKQAYPFEKWGDCAIHYALKKTDFGLPE